MEDKDFDKIFKRTLEQASGKPATEGGWAAMSERMDANRNKRLGWVLPLLIALIGLLGFGNVFWWYQWRQVAKQYPTASAQVIVKSDTIIKNTVVYHYDTVYRYITTVQTWQAPQRTNKLATAPLPSTADGAALTPLPTEEASIQNRTQHSTGTPASGQNRKIPPTDQQANNDKIANHPASETNAGKNSKTPPTDHQINDGKNAPPSLVADSIEHQTAVHPPLPTNPEPKTPQITKQTAQTSLDTTATSPVLPIVKKKRDPIFYLARLRIGLTAGWAQPVLEERQSSNTWQAGIVTDVEIAPKLHVEATVLYQKNNLSAYKSSSLGNAVWVPNPGNDYWLE